MNPITGLFLIGAMIGLVPCAFADTGVAMILLTGPSAITWLILIPIIYIEARVYLAILGVDLRKAVVYSFWANLLSTALGIFLYPILSRPAYLPILRIPMIPAVNFLVGGFFISWLSEGYVIRRGLFHSGTRRRVIYAVGVANGMSYILLAGIFLADIILKVFQLEPTAGLGR